MPSLPASLQASLPPAMQHVMPSHPPAIPAIHAPAPAAPAPPAPAPPAAAADQEGH